MILVWLEGLLSSSDNCGSCTMARGNNGCRSNAWCKLLSRSQSKDPPKIKMGTDLYHEEAPPSWRGPVVLGEIPIYVILSWVSTCLLFLSVFSDSHDFSDFLDFFAFLPEPWLRVLFLRVLGGSAAGTNQPSMLDNLDKHA